MGGATLCTQGATCGGSRAPVAGPAATASTPSLRNK
eukprot:CAMPEP_0179322918 /NCGR_PEP_ID=MMETSP0797-20121207/59434_1 /TAXON_ID=47934 /ORGANISM="Dinophysis acuminata, Strain DAEP01" /LENGTH=35 /DNA_ID= /DNA_START= /DNA_END= /DNA_ORIENTATION=